MRDTSQQAKQIAEALASGRKVADLANKVLGLQTVDKLKLAASLLLLGHVEIAESVAKRAVDEIQLARMFGKRK